MLNHRWHGRCAAPSYPGRSREANGCRRERMSKRSGGMRSSRRTSRRLDAAATYPRQTPRVIPRFRGYRRFVRDGGENPVAGTRVNGGLERRGPSRNRAKCDRARDVSRARQMTDASGRTWRIAEKPRGECARPVAGPSCLRPRPSPQQATGPETFSRAR